MVLLANPRKTGRGRCRCAGFESVFVSDVEGIDVMVEFVAVLPFDLKQVCVV